MSLSLELGNQRRRRRRIWMVLAVVLAVLAAGGIVAWRYVGGATGRASQAAAEEFADAWSEGTLGRLQYAGTSGAEVASSYRTIVGDLGAEAVRVRVADVSVDGNAARARIAVSWKLSGQATWRYDTTAELALDGGEWAVRWTPATVHPSLRADVHLATARTQPARATILGRDGDPLVTERPVVKVGVVPGKVPDPGALADSLRDLLAIEAERLEQRIRDAGDDVFVHVVTLREADFVPLGGRLRALPGVTWSDDSLPLAPTTEFAGALLGRVGPVTAEVMKESGGRYRAGDLAGLSGMQRRYDKRLAGKTGLRVLAVPSEDGDRSAEPEELFTREPVRGKPVHTTLDPRVQRAADTALAGVTENSALVAVHVPSGGVLAVANGPDVGGYNRALRGRYPPGSTFKVVSTLALLREGVELDETVRCPEYATVDGKSWHNYKNFELGAVPFRVDFAKSCNTAFIGLASRLDDRALTRAAATLGIGRPYRIGVPAFSGDVPPTTSRIDHAAAMIGQARVLASPLAMATAAGTVARGEYLPPSLVVQPEPANQTKNASAQPPGQLDDSRAETLRGLMRKVVTSGSGGAVADVPGAPVVAKTGTAEYGTADPPETHVWMIGIQDDLAFAVFVENGDSGGQVAGPIAADFLEGLAQ